MNIGDVFWLFRGESKQLVIDAQKAGAAAGDAGAASFSQRYGAKLKTAVGGAVGATVGLALAGASRGALELDAAVQQLAADTGMTADEADRARHAMAGMFGRNLQSFDQIGEAMARVHNDLGLAGADAEAATESFLRFATATRQDAAGAVSTFDDILDAWNLTADQAGGLMDKLVVSHQKFGGVIPESEAALVAMAPALQAANADIDDGIALLNLFNAAGLDAAKAPAALARAVKGLKPGEDLDDLIAQIAAIEDPTLRAQKAMEIFGARSGIGFAQAIRPGMTSLDDFTAALGDVEGATRRSADEVESSFGNRAKLALKEFGAALAEVGTNLGDVLMIAAILGPSLTTKLTAALGGLAGALSPALSGVLRKVAVSTGISAAAAFVGDKIATGYLSALIAGDRLQAAIGGAWTSLTGSGSFLAKVTASGTTAGRVFAAGATAAILAAPVVVAWIFAEKGKEDTARFMAARQAEVDAILAKRGEVDSLRADIAQLQEEAKVLQGILDSPFPDLFGMNEGNRADLEATLRQIDQLKAKLAETEAAASGAGAAFVDGYTSVLAQAAPRADAAAERLVIGSLERLGPRPPAYRLGQEVPLGFSEGILARQAVLTDAMATLRDLMKRELTPTRQIGRDIGILLSDEIRKGIDDKRPGVRAAAQQIREDTRNELVALIEAGGRVGDQAMERLRRAMHDKNPQVRREAREIVRLLEESKASAGGAGWKVGSQFIGQVAAAIAAGDFKVNFRTFGTTSVTTAIGAAARGHAGGGRETAGVPRIVGERGWEAFVPDTDGYTVSHDDAIAALSSPQAVQPAEPGGSTIVLMLPDGRVLGDVVAPHVTVWQQSRLLLRRA